MRRMRARRALAGCAVVAVALTGCTSEPPVEGDPSPEPTESVDVDATEAADLRLRLEQQFAMFAAAAGALVRDPGEAQTTAFDQSVKDLAGTVADAYDQQTAQDLDAVIRRYPPLLGDYGKALVATGEELLRGGDRPTAAARRAVLRLPVQVAAYMSTVTGGGMQEDGTAALVRAPTVSLLQVVAADVEGDHETAYARQREAYAAMVSVGRAFAAGITEQQPETFPGLRNTGALELRSALQQLLGEHAVLATEVLRRGLRGARDFEAAAAALNGNTEDLTAALESIYADDATQVSGLWRERISTLAESAVAVAQERTKRAAQLRTALTRTDDSIVAELEAMSEEAIAADDATEHLQSLTAALLQHAAAAAAKDRARATAAVADAHDSAAALAEVVAGGIAQHRPSEFPTR